MSKPRATFRPCAAHLAPARAHLAAQLAALDLYLADSTPAHFAAWVATTDAAELWAASTARSCASCRTGAAVEVPKVACLLCENDALLSSVLADLAASDPLGDLCPKHRGGEP